MACQVPQASEIVAQVLLMGMNQSISAFNYQFPGRVRGVLVVLPASGRSSVWLEHQLWELRVVGSNPVAPTIFPYFPIPL